MFHLIFLELFVELNNFTEINTVNYLRDRLTIDDAQVLLSSRQKMTPTYQEKKNERLCRKTE